MTPANLKTIFNGKKDDQGGVGEDFQQRSICELLDQGVSGFVVQWYK